MRRSCRQSIRLICIGCGVCLLAAACDSELAETDRRFSAVDSAGIAIVENHSAPDDRPELQLSERVLSIGDAEGSDSQLLSRVGGATRLSDGSIALADNGSVEIRIYDRSGNLGASFGSRGEGPRQFIGVLGPWQIEAGAARLAAYDFRGQRLTTLTMDGEYVDVQPLRPPSANPPQVVGVLNDLTVVQLETAWVGDPAELTQATAHVVVFAPPDWMRDTIYSAPSKHRGFVTTSSGRETMVSPLFDSSVSAAAGDSLIVISDCSEPEFRTIDRDGRLTAVARWTSGERVVNEEDVERFYETMTAGLPPDRQRVERERLDASPIREVFPACDSPHPLLGGAIRIGTDHDVWVREYMRPSQTDQSWLRFRDGVMQGRLLLDESMSVQEFGRDYVLVVERDELDVEHVREYGLIQSDDA